MNTITMTFPVFCGQHCRQFDGSSAIMENGKRGYICGHRENKDRSIGCANGRTDGIWAHATRKTCPIWKRAERRQKRGYVMLAK